MLFLLWTYHQTTRPGIIPTRSFGTRLVNYPDIELWNEVSELPRYRARLVNYPNTELWNEVSELPRYRARLVNYPNTELWNEVSELSQYRALERG